MHPLSPVLQPPLPLHEFWPLHECLSEAVVAVSPEVPALMDEPLVELPLLLLHPRLVDAAPATSPVMAAAARKRVEGARIQLLLFEKQCPSRPATWLGRAGHNLNPG